MIDMDFVIRCNGFIVHSFTATNINLAECEFYRFCASRLGDSLDRFDLYASSIYYNPLSADGSEWELVCSYSDFLDLIDRVVYTMRSYLESEEVI